MSDYPEHDKLHRKTQLVDFTQELGAWLDDNNYQVCELVCRSCHRPPHDRHGGPDNAEWTRVPITGGINGLLAAAFDINPQRLETEKRAMLNAQRAWNRANS